MNTAVTATTILNAPVPAEKKHGWSKGFPSPLLKQIIKPTFLSIDELKSTAIQNNALFTQIAPSQLQMEVLLQAVNGKHTVLFTEISEIARIFNIIDKRVLLVHTHHDSYNQDIELEFYYLPRTPYLAAKSRPLYNATYQNHYRRLNTANREVPVNFKFTKEINRLRRSKKKYEKDEAHQFICDNMSEFFNHFDLIVDLSNCAIYKRNHDIVLEEKLNQNCHTEAEIFTYQQVHECINDLLKQIDQTHKSNPKPYTISLYKKDNRSCAKLRRLSLGVRPFELEYVAIHKFLLFRFTRQDLAMLALIDIRQMKNLLRDGKDLSPSVIEYDYGLKSSKLRKKYIISGQTRVCGDPYEHIS